VIPRLWIGIKLDVQSVEKYEPVADICRQGFAGLDRQDSLSHMTGDVEVCLGGIDHDASPAAFDDKRAPDLVGCGQPMDRLRVAIGLRFPLVADLKSVRVCAMSAKGFHP